MRALGRPAAGLIAAVAWSILLSVPAAADAPRVFVYPNPATDGQQAVVYGQNFCAASGCSNVTVSVDGQAVATAVKVKSDGSFAAGFTVTQLFGEHTATASQTDAGGATISASGGFRVAAGDVTSTSPTPLPSSHPPTPSATTPVGQQSPSSGSGRSGGEAAPTGGAGWILGIVLALAFVLVLAGAAIVLARRRSER